MDISLASPPPSHCYGRVIIIMMIYIGFDSTLRPAEWINSAKTFLSCPKDWLRWEMEWWCYSEHMAALTILLMWGGQ